MSHLFSREYENESEVEEKYKRQLKLLDFSGTQKYIIWIMNLFSFCKMTSHQFLS